MQPREDTSFARASVQEETEEPAKPVNKIPSMIPQTLIDKERKEESLIEQKFLVR